MSQESPCLTEERLIEIMDEALEKRSRIDAESHAEHHAFIAALIEREHRKREMWEAIARQVLGWGAVAIAGAIGSVILKSLKVYLTAH
jgi:hypothetical protein